MNKEPVAIAEAVRSVLVMLIAFGLDVSAEQMAAIMVALGAVLALFVRQQVTSPATLEREYKRKN